MGEDIGKRNEFVVVIKKSNFGSALKKIKFDPCIEAEWGYREDKRARNVSGVIKIKGTGTEKCECPFQLKGKKLTTDDDWLLLVVCEVYNHPTADHLEGHFM